MTAPVTVALDRTMRVPPGHLVKTAYVPMERIRLACTDRMNPAAVERAFQRRLCNRPGQQWPPPRGYWEDGTDGARTFVIEDGRHEYISALMVGDRSILVAWIEPPHRWQCANCGEAVEAPGREERRCPRCDGKRFERIPHEHGAPL